MLAAGEVACATRRLLSIEGLVCAAAGVAFPILEQRPLRERLRGLRGLILESVHDALQVHALSTAHAGELLAVYSQLQGASVGSDGGVAAEGDGGRVNAEANSAEAAAVRAVRTIAPQVSPAELVDVFYQARRAAVERVVGGVERVVGGVERVVGGASAATATAGVAADALATRLAALHEVVEHSEPEALIEAIVAALDTPPHPPPSHRYIQRCRHAWRRRNVHRPAGGACRRRLLRQARRIQRDAISGA